MAVDSFAFAAPANFHSGVSARSGTKHVIRVRHPDLCQVETLRRSKAAAPKKLIRAATPASQSDGLTSAEGPS